MKIRIIILSCLIIRLFTLGLPDLSDPSESRFANAAQYMIESGDWITPYIHSSFNQWNPYLAKPPLAIWLTALSFSIFDHNTWSARIPAFLASCITLLFCYLLITKLVGVNCGLNTVLLLLASPVFLFLGTSNITDPILLTCITGALVCYWFGVAEDKLSARWGFFFFIGLGFLTKGPVIYVLTLLPILSLALIRKDFSLVRKLPWVGGIALTLIIALPWYLIVEERNPGFLHYFFVQENFGRYFLYDFGIKYGSTHRKIYGTSWLYMFLISLPWSFLIFVLFKKNQRTEIFNKVRGDIFYLFLLSWMVTAPLFFAFGKQLLPTYVFSSMPPLMMLIVLLNSRHVIPRLQVSALLIIITSFLFLFAFHKKISLYTSTRQIVAVLQEKKINEKIGSFLKVPQSLVFYSWNTGMQFYAVQNEAALKQSEFHYAIIENKDYYEKLSDDTREIFPIFCNVSPWLIIKRN